MNACVLFILIVKNYYNKNTKEIGQMAKTVSFDFKNAASMATAEEIAAMNECVTAAKATLVNKTGEGNDFLGWIDLPVDYDKEEFARIKKAAAKIQADSDVLVVIGIGGSYLGARAAIEALRHSFYNSVSKEIRKTPEIYYAGSNISSTYMAHLLQVIGDRDFSINIISKSGTTTEPGIAARIFKKKLVEKYGKEEAAKRIYATTDKAKGALKTLATEEGYETFVVPDDVGGRFSVLTAVGLLPIAVSGADIDKLMEGAASAREDCLAQDFDESDAMKYAAVRNILYNKGKSIEILLTSSLHSTMYQSGGSSYTERVRVRMARAYSQQLQTSQQIFTHLDSSSSRVHRTTLRLLSMLRTQHARSLWRLRTQILTDLTTLQVRLLTSQIRVQ